jgi:hypothetical protein
LLAEHLHGFIWKRTEVGLDSEMNRIYEAFIDKAEELGKKYFIPHEEITELTDTFFCVISDEAQFCYLQALKDLLSIKLDENLINKMIRTKQA